MWCIVKILVLLLLVLFIYSTVAQEVKRSFVAEYNMDCPMDDDPEDPTHLPVPGDCTSFFKCFNGKAYHISCPINQHWSIELDRCESISRAQCDPSATTLKPIIGGNGCEFDFKLDSTDCTKAIQCVNGKEYPLNCLSNMYWNQTNKRCELNTGQCKIN